VASPESGHIGKNQEEGEGGGGRAATIPSLRKEHLSWNHSSILTGDWRLDVITITKKVPTNPLGEEVEKNPWRTRRTTEK